MVVSNLHGTQESQLLEFSLRFSEAVGFVGSDFFSADFFLGHYR